MYLYGHKTITIKEKSVDQSSCNSMRELIHEYQVCETVPSVVRGEK